MNVRIKDKSHLNDLFWAAMMVAGVGWVCYFADHSLIIPVLLVFLGYYLTYFKKADRVLFLQLGLLLAITFFTSHAFMEYTFLSFYYIPVASVAMLTTLLYSDLQLSFIMSLLSSVIVGLVAGSNFDAVLIFFIGSLMAAFVVKEARTRGRLIEAGVLVAAIQVLCVVLLKPSVDVLMTKDFIFNYLKPLVINGFVSAFVVIATCKIFESCFGVLTNFSLLELSDFNHPLLKKMTLEAPGTYHHSLVVSNLAEAAADAIGAHALLTRVGACYHDIGKTVKPEYFTENQLYGGNKHDDLEPSMSRLVILNHVKEGIELAKRYKLDRRIIDFIPQHHGTSLIYYFYQRALEANQSEAIEESNFRYPGPKPQSRETAIVLLADSAEGAVRALEDSTPSRIDEVVRKVINNKFIDGQLDECTLTLRDMEIIAATFIRILSAMHHSRIKYPEKKNGKNGNGNHGKKSSEENPAKSASDYPGRKKNFTPSGS